MTTLSQLSERGQRLHSELESRGLAPMVTVEAPDVAGPLSSVAFGSEGSNGADVDVVVAVTADAGLELFDVVVAAAQASLPELEPSTAVSVGTVDELIAKVHRPVEMLSLTRDGAVIGAALVPIDQRSDLTGQPEVPLADNPAPTVRPAGAGAPDLSMLGDVVLEVTVELGRETMTLAQLLHLGVGSVVELDRAAGSPVDIRVNGMLFGRGEVVVVEEEYAVRIVEILESPGSDQ